MIRKFRKQFTLFVFFAGIFVISSDLSAQQTPEKKLNWKLGAQAYTFNRFTFFEAIDKIKSCGLEYVEGYPGQPIGGGIEGNMDYHMSKEKRNLIRTRLKTKGVKMISFGVTVADTEADWRRLFEFGKALGVKNLTVEPDPKYLPFLSSLCDSFKINLAIHNHPQPSRYWNPDVLLATLKGQSERIGACADIGHWVRSGLDPLECLQKLQGHIIQLHFKDLNEKSPKAHDVHWGQGVSRVDDLLLELKRQHFKGLFSVEYEHNWENNVPDVTASVNYFRNFVNKIK